MPVPVILDVDTGVDDALALLFAARHTGLELRAVTCVAGNAAVDQVVTNTLTVLDAAGAADVPVARGADRPLLEPGRPARHVHGEDGLGDLHWPAPPTRVDPRDAVELLRDELLAAEQPITLVTLAPLTNIALLLRSHPRVAAGIERIVFKAALLAASDDPGARLAGQLLQFSLARYRTDTATIGDAGAVCAVADPGGLPTERLPVRVELTGTWTALVDVALGVDGPRYAELWRSVVAGGSSRQSQSA